MVWMYRKEEKKERKWIVIILTFFLLNLHSYRWQCHHDTQLLLLFIANSRIHGARTQHIIVIRLYHSKLSMWYVYRLKTTITNWFLGDLSISVIRIQNFKRTIKNPVFCWNHSLVNGITINDFPRSISEGKSKY